MTTKVKPDCYTCDVADCPARSTSRRGKERGRKMDRSHAEAILRTACEEIVRNSDDPGAKGYCRWCHGWNCAKGCPVYIADQALQQANESEEPLS